MLATSAGVPKRPTGMRSALAFRSWINISVLIRAGAMALTVMPSRASREAKKWVRPISPALEAA